MKKLTIEELTKVVETLFGKIECIEVLMKEKNLLYKKNDRAKNGLKLEKCSSNFNKRDLAQFFYILMDEKILFFDANRIILTISSSVFGTATASGIIL